MVGFLSWRFLLLTDQIPFGILPSNGKYLWQDCNISFHMGQLPVYPCIYCFSRHLSEPLPRSLCLNKRLITIWSYQCAAGCCQKLLGTSVTSSHEAGWQSQSHSGSTHQTGSLALPASWCITGALVYHDVATSYVPLSHRGQGVSSSFPLEIPFGLGHNNFISLLATTLYWKLVLKVGSSCVLKGWKDAFLSSRMLERSSFQ